MKNKLSCLTAERLASKSRYRTTPGLVSLGALITLLGSPWASAVTPPQWMLAHVAVSTPEHGAETNAVKLYSEIVVTVQTDGKIRKSERVVYRILRIEGATRALARVDYTVPNRVLRMRGWSIPADGKAHEATEKDSVESALIGVPHSELVGDLRSKVLRIPAAAPGSTVGYEIEQELQPYALVDTWAFQDTIPVREAQYILELPPGWHFRATWINHPEVAVTQPSLTRWQWQVHDVKAIKPESQMPPMAAVAGRLALTLLAPGDHESGFLSWNGMGAWYLNLTRGRREASADIKKKVLELTAPRPTTLGKVQALASFVQTEIRYVAIELSIGRLQPHSAADVFTHRYGDCKDKVTLLSSMLREIGLDSFYLIVNTARGAVTPSAPLGLGFNHAILAIQVPKDIEDPTLLAMIPHAKLGRLLLFDPTDHYTPLGQIAGHLQGGYGLLVAPDGGELIKLPELPPSANVLRREAHFQLDASGRLSGEVHEVRVGDPAASERSALDSAVQKGDRIKTIESVMADSFPTFQLTRAVITNRPEPNKPLEWTYALEVDQYAKVSGDLLTARARVLGSKSSRLLETREPREYDIEFEGTRRDTDAFEIALPEGYEVDELPPPVDEEHPFATYHSKTEAVGRTLRYTRALELRSVSVPVVQADELKAFYRVIVNDERMPVVLKRIAR